MRPLLVLALVLVAIAALIFGIVRLLPDSPATTDGNSGVATSADTDAPSPPAADLVDTSGGTRMDAPSAGRTASPSDDVTRTVEAVAGSGFDNRLTGLVRNPNNQPVVGAEVTISTVNTGDMFFVNDPIDTSKDVTVRTSNEGRYTFRDIEPRSKYRLIVKHSDYTRYETSTVPVGENGSYEEPPIVLTAGASLTGHVKDKGGNSVDKAVLYLDNQMYQGAPYDPPDRMTAKSDGQGYYSFINVPAGLRTLTVSAAGYGSITLNGLSFDREGTLQRDVVLDVAEPICGRVVDEQDQGIAGARVTALGFSSTQQSQRGEIVTDDKGEFCFEDLAPGPYNIVAVAKGYHLERTMRAETGSRDTRLEMIRDPDVSGQVIDASSGAPVTSFTVRLRFFYGVGNPSQPSEVKQTFNHPQGEFTLPGVAASEYVVEAMAPGYAPSFSQNFSMAGGKSITGIIVRMTRGGSMSGRVVDAAGKPVPRARIQTKDNEWADDDFAQILGGEYPTNITAADVRAGEDGRFVLSGLSPEVYQILVSGGGYTRYSQTGIQVSDGNETKVGDIVLSKGGTLRGTVYDPSGKPLAGAQVTLTPLEGMTPDRYSAKAGEDGKFVITNIAPKRYSLSATRPGSGMNPFEQLVDAKNSAKDIVISEDTTTVQDLNLPE
ncbi:MAG: carboxypeptidase-like regulatory domain-containing protein [Planctomycetota bacterium]